MEMIPFPHRLGRCTATAIVPVVLFLFCYASGASAACTPQPLGLVDWWRGEGDANDFVGTNNGALLNGATFARGLVGQAFSFGGGNAVVNIPDATSLNPSSALTLETWVFFSQFPANDVAVIGKDNPSGARQYLIGIGGVSGKWVFRAHIGVASGFQLFNGRTALQTNTWYHVAMTYDGSTLNLFVNGAFDSNLAVPGPMVVTADPLLIGGYGQGPWGFNGLVDEPTLYDRALSTNEVLAIYNAGAAGKCIGSAAPVIYSQPTDQTVTAGQTVSFTVSANGSPPLMFQWEFNRTELVGATNSSLTLMDVQTNQAGNYTVLVTNTLGMILSSNAVLTVNTAPACSPPPPGLVSWWRGEDDANDVSGANDGALLNGATFAPGLVGQAFSFGGGNAVVSVPDSPSLNPSSSLTLEAWVRFSQFPANDVALFGKDNPYGARQYLIGIGGVSGHWVFRAHLGVASGFKLFNGTMALQNNTWYHVAMTYDGSTLSLFVNGAFDSNLAVPGPMVVTTDPLLIGGYGQGPWGFNGLIDEPTLYDRALSTNEVLAIYHAGAGGKCPGPIPPTIANQPLNQTLTIGQTAIFTVGAGGTQPLSYQWTSNGVSVLNATNASLVITNVQMSQAGTFAAQVTNLFGSVNSSNATLTVTFPPAKVAVENSTAMPAGDVTVPIMLLANGNENALGFSLSFNPALLSYAGINLGSGAAGANLIVNSNQVSTGLLGVALSLPTGASFLAGTQEVVDISFAAAALTRGTVGQLTFGDQPTKRELSDPQANPLAANFIGGTVSIPAADFEGDVSPRPNGDKVVTITDWVLEGRYVARLDYPTNASEYQRADCAPRSTLGDGAITVADWVQVGRYAAGLDPATRAGGPTNDLGPNVVNLTSRIRPSPKGLNRQVRVANINLVQGQSGTVSVYLDAQGGENALGFSLAFNSSVLAYLSASLGADASGATLDINTNQAAAGHAAFVLALPIGSGFAAGTKEVLKLKLGSVPSAAGLYPLALTDQPVVRQVVDTNATPLITTYMNGSIAVNPPPSLTATRAQQNINLSWPLWATNFALQEADGTLLPSLTWSNVPTALTITNNEAVVTLPIGGTTKFYRLQK